ncbi:MAG TPA: NADH-quinone oxidoreductase subunit L [Planctomycetaceae bacterium]|nr:NADH-quinone oxidoreductase subunit L [Planctomycetaceae bacterium]
MTLLLAQIAWIALVPALPLLAAILTAILGARYLKKLSHWPVLAATAASLLISLMLLVEPSQNSLEGEQQAGAAKTVTLWNWVHVEEAQPTKGFDLVINVALRADGLTVVMLTMVTFISLLVTVFSVGYMHDDRGYWRFFSYLGLFIFSMTMLVSVNNFLLLFVFWEAVGMCSYLLIGFWYEKPAAAAAGKKAFLVNRVGDFGFMLAIFLIWQAYGTLNYYGTGNATGVLDSTASGGTIGLLICLLLMLGACGKSAQFPLHVWLPDAVEGPSPVSALIHAATMVTAGVYMVVRCWPLFEASETAQVTVACIGCFTALLAGLIALTQFDLKRVLAYSTISQLGYMFLALGTGLRTGILAAMFHLVTHAFFKALLFLGSGSVLHATGGTVDMRQFGGLRHRMPITHVTFLIGCLGLAGFPLLAGWWSKNAILAAVHERGLNASYGDLYTLLFGLATFTALLTAIYTFRAFLLTFYGPERIPAEAGDHPHESPRSMWIPLAILAVGTCIIGFMHHPLDHWLQQTPGLPELQEHEGEHGIGIMVMSGLVAIVGIGLAGWLYGGGSKLADGLAGFFKRCGLYQLSEQKFYLDSLYWGLVVWPLRSIALLCYAVDRWVIDRIVDSCGRGPRSFGGVMRSLQMGLTSFYALAMILGLLVLMAARLLSQMI